jgi:hypothetical protein
MFQQNAEMGFVGKHAGCMLWHVDETVNSVFKLFVTFWEKKVYQSASDQNKIEMDVWVA